jgi:hypothetical protein
MPPIAATGPQRAGTTMNLALIRQFLRFSMNKLVAAVLSGVALSASAYGCAFNAATVPDSAGCPAGTSATVPVYEWQDGRFVSVGWKCESIYSRYGS